MLTHVDWRDVRFGDGFLGDRVRMNRTATIPAVWKHTKETGRADALKLNWQEGDPNRPHHFWDSDVAKWIEAAAYDLAIEPNAATEAIIDELVADMEAGQLEDGYFNSFYQQVCLDQRWSNLRDMHELYCAGHLIEGAVAYFLATGKRAFLDVMCRYADYIDQTFGREEGKMAGYPGHEELELALVKLAKATGEQRYQELANYFVTERGQQPHYYDEEAVRRGDDPKRYWHGSYAYTQAHLPAKEQTTAEGHSVRACYFYSGMADVARIDGDDELAAACRAIWQNLTRRRMYVTGAIGSSFDGERFTIDYDLPNETSYAETCAQISLVFFASRMLQLEPKGEYADVMELAFYNSVLSGVSLDGERIFYVNPHAYFPQGYRFDPRGHRIAGTRPEWHGCACCPSNLARLLASLGGYLYSTDGDRLYIHLYGSSTVDCEWGKLSVTTGYPFDGGVRLQVETAPAGAAKLCLRFPGWARSYEIAVNGEAVQGAMEDGYLVLERQWQAGDEVSLSLPMPVEMVEAHPAVRHDVGRVVLKRGPLVYCLESVDNGTDLNQLRLTAHPDFAVSTQEIAGLAVPVIQANALRDDADAWGDTLYRTVGQSRTQPVQLTAVPYFMWANRGGEEMLLWIRRA